MQISVYSMDTAREIELKIVIYFTYKMYVPLDLKI